MTLYDFIGKKIFINYWYHGKYYENHYGILEEVDVGDICSSLTIDDNEYHSLPNHLIRRTCITFDGHGAAITLIKNENDEILYQNNDVPINHGIGLSEFKDNIQKTMIRQLKR